jgi:hypothetical protein
MDDVGAGQRQGQQERIRGDRAAGDDCAVVYLDRCQPERLVSRTLVLN